MAVRGDTRAGARCDEQSIAPEVLEGYDVDTGSLVHEVLLERLLVRADAFERPALHVRQAYVQHQSPFADDRGFELAVGQRARRAGAR